MDTPHIGRNISLAIIFLFLVWTGMRSLGARPPASPSAPVPTPALDEQLVGTKSTESAVFAGGCFWGVQGVFQHVKGVQEAVSGYSGGFTKSPSYESVSLGITGHAESVRVTYDPSQVTFGQLLMAFFSAVHDPTQLNRQGPDTGSQYRSAIFYTSDEQKRIAKAYIAQLTNAHVYTRPIVTKVEKLNAFYPAENYHQDYARNFPNDSYIVFNDLPKISRLQRDLPALYRAN